MKKLVITIALLIVCYNLSGQVLEHSLLKGNWKIVAVDNGDVYMNFKNDSISLSDEFKEIYPDSVSTDFLKGMMRALYANNYMFDGHKFEIKLWGGELMETGTYQIDTSRKLIGVTTKNAFGQNVANNWLYFMNHGVLNLSIHVGRDIGDKPMKLELEKFH